MRQGARIKAAEDVLVQVLQRHRPASLALADWGKAHRFAGSGDRAAVGNLVFDALRRKASIAARMNADSPRGLALGAAVTALGLTSDEVIAAADGTAYAMAPLDRAEAAALTAEVPAGAPDWVRADVPEWLWPSFLRVFGAEAVDEGRALAERAPVDLRVNTLKAERQAVLDVLAKFGAQPARYSPVGVRLPPPEAGRRQANVEAEAAHGRGWYEVQDEGSQIAAAMVCARPGMQVLDFCAGAGGKTLALAAAMENKGLIHAFDSDKVQLRPIFERITRAGASNVEVVEAGDHSGLERLTGQMDRVLIDAPCSGSGVWRRRPDAKWRLKAANIRQRQGDQKKVLAQAISYLRPGGRLVYVTCSVLAEENTDTVSWLIKEAGDLTLLPYGEVWAEAFGEKAPPPSADGHSDTLLLTPSRHGTDGFFIAVLQKAL